MLQQARGDVCLKSSLKQGSGILESPLPIRPFPSLVKVPVAFSKQELPSFTPLCKEKPFLPLLFYVLAFFQGRREMGGGLLPRPPFSLPSSCRLWSLIAQGEPNQEPSSPKISKKPKKEADVLNPVEKRMICAAAAQRMEATGATHLSQAGKQPHGCFPSQLHFSTVLAAMQVSKTLSKHFHVV